MIKLKYIIAFLFQVFLISTILLITRSCKKDRETIKVIETQDYIEFDNPSKDVDTQFLVAVAKFNLMQISLGQLVQQYTLNKGIKAMAKVMELEHSKLMVEVTGLASKKHIKIPVMPTNSVKDAYKMLSNKSGTDFERAYFDLMVNEHRNAILLFDKASNESNDIDINAWAAKTLPLLDLHLDYAINCQSICKSKK